MENLNINEKLFEEAQLVIPGGVNSPVRAFQKVGQTPIFAVRGEGACIWDAQGKKYTDYIGSWGPLILGHAYPPVIDAVCEAAKEGTSFGLPTPREVEMAQLITELVDGVEMVRMVSSGTEAVLSALRAARGFTGRSLILKFEGCYHGHSDAMLVKAGSGLATAGQPDSAGVPAETAAATLTCRYNDLDAVKAIFAAHKGEIAAVIVEPVGANMGVVPPAEGFLEGLRRVTKEDGALLIFDEVITGFRLSIHCASAYFGITPDMWTFGKIIGGGLPVGAYGGRRDVMSMVAPIGPVYQAGTLSGNPVAMAAGLAALSALRENPLIYGELEVRGERLRKGLRLIFEKQGLPACVQGEGSLSTVFFTEGPVMNYDDASKSDTERYARFWRGMAERGILMAPSQFEALFISAAHTVADIEYFIASADEVIGAKGF
ncbi:MAG: glutamate-1-semialdehyde 2,1-aminomutase [Cloacibacillus sp.]